VDVFGEGNGRRIFVEVETGQSDIPANVAKCADLDGEVVFLFTDENVRRTHEPMILLLLPKARVMGAAELELFQ